MIRTTSAGLRGSCGEAGRVSWEAEPGPGSWSSGALAPDWVWGGAATGLEQVRELPGLCRRVRSLGDWPRGGS